MAGETLQALRHKMDYWKTVGYPGRPDARNLLCVAAGAEPNAW
jgi:hypothetical protein